jgi:Ca-activated chloride channel family protein
MSFAAPFMLWLLVFLVLPLIAFLFWTWRVKQKLITQFIAARLLEQLKVGVNPSRQKARLVMIVLAVVCAILALARPQWGVTREEVRQRGLDIMVAIDTSNSMLAEDVTPSRLARAKLAVLDLLHRARTDRMGLIAFAGSAFLECPLTLDDAAFAQSVNVLDTKTISQGGTAIADAIDEASKAFKDQSDNHRVLVLFTDGEDHDSDAVAAAQRAAKDGMIVFTIGIGTPQGELLRIHDEHGRLDYIRDEQGKPVKSHLDEALLQQIASATKGFYLPLRGTKTMDTLYDQGLAPLPKSEKSAKMFQRYREQFQWFLVAAILLLILEMFLPDRGRRRSRKLAVEAEKSGSAAGTVVVLLLLSLPLAARASPSSALREYNDGKYEDALKDYDKALQKKQDDPRLHFNTGAAAYRSHELEQATKEFNEALRSPDLKLQEQAYYNLGNTLFRSGEQAQDPKKKQEAWENAIKSYESASKLNQQDADSQYNQQFVKKMLEELKKQQQQQQKNSDKNQKQDNKDQKDQKDRKDQQGKQDQPDQKDKKDQQSKGQQGDKQSQDQQKKDQSDQKSQADNKVKEKSDEEKKQEQKDRQQAQKDQQDQQPSDEQKQQQQAQAGEQDKEKAEEAKREAAMMAAGQMTPQQAKQLLDAQKDDERVFQLAPPNKNVSQGRNFKNW